MYRILLIIFYSTMVSSIFSQVCEGNLGSNIFEDGNFGTGSSNILANDPGIAPGYSYNTNPPPPDGFYTISNNTGEWANLYPTWLRIRDNSNDPDGYMMVVNASFEPGDFYDEIIDGLCENTLYEFSADIINMIAPGIPDHLDPNVDFLLNGEVQYSTGNINKTGSWNTYGFTFTTNPDQTEIRLTLRNNAPGGIGNDLALDNISFRPCGPAAFIDLDTEETIFICQDGNPVVITADVDAGSNQEFNIQWQRSLDMGETWSDLVMMNDAEIMHSLFEVGTYLYRYLSASTETSLMNDRCRIISDEITLEVLPLQYALRDSICDGSIYMFGDRALVNDGVYVDTFTSSIGCDSIVSLELDVLTSLPIQADISVTDPSCYLFEDGSISIDNVTGGYGEYTISIDTHDILNNLSGLAADTYPVVIMDRFGCVYDTDVTLLQPDSFIIELPVDMDIVFGDAVDLDINSNFPLDRIEWSPVDIINCQNCVDATALPFDDVIISAIAYNENDCEATDEIIISVDRSRAVFFPNVFSPNNDGINDVFYVKSYKNSVEIIPELQIFDRYGNIVFSAARITANDINTGWDGKIEGRALESGVYTYVMEVQYIDGSLEKYTGDITLIK